MAKHAGQFLGGPDPDEALAGFKQIEDNAGNTLVSEGIDANFLDIVNYAVFAMIQLDEGVDDASKAIGA